MRDFQFDRLGLTIFEKKRVLKARGERFSLPLMLSMFEGPVWIDEEMWNLKSRLNETKSLLDSFELDNWHKHTKRMNTAGRVGTQVKKVGKPEFASQAWCKFYECLNTYPILHKVFHEVEEKPGVELGSVHLCEAPGAFISATNHYVRTFFPDVKWKWMATTLNPYNEGNEVGTMINDDKLIISSLEDWTFLEDRTGNIMNLGNVEYLIKEVERKFKNEAGRRIPVHLVTADGSIDCQTTPLEQEARVAELHFAEIVAALHILEKGGSFVLKVFTFLECQTLSNLYLLTTLFEEVHLFKPATSKEGNSEVYVVCLGYVGRTKYLAQLNYLKTFIGKGIGKTLSFISESIIKQDPFWERAKEAASFFTGFQIGIITRNVQTYPPPDNSFYFCYEILQSEVAQKWVSKFNLKELPKSRRIFANMIRNGTSHMDPRGELGSFEDKVLRLSAGVWIKLKLVKDELDFYKRYKNVNVIKAEIRGEVSMSLSWEKPYRNIQSSRFCFSKLLSHRQSVRNAAKRFVPYMYFGDDKHLDENRCSEEFLKRAFRHILPGVEDLNIDEKWVVHSLCFHETPYHLYLCTDIERTSETLSMVLAKLKVMKKNESLFLCEYSLLTRLHVGLIYVISPLLFETTMLCLHGTRALRGVMLHKFKGISTSEQKTLIEKLTKIISKLSLKEDKVALQIVPMDKLARLPCYDEIFKYNLYNTASHLEELIKETRRMLADIKFSSQNDFSPMSILAETPDEIEFLNFI